MKRTYFISMLIVVSALLILPGMAQAEPPEPHKFIQEYEGPGTCEKCHVGAADEVFHSVHYTWSEKMEHYSPLPASIAEINWLGILNPEMEISGGCGRCHVGGGPMPGTEEAASPEAKDGIDCLVCHSESYDMDERYPVQDEDGNWTIPGDRSLAAARTASRPSDEACLRCHLNAGGGQLAKRGVDFAAVADRHAEESYGDVHAERGLVCVDCHAGEEHKVYGFAPTLWSRDYEDERLACADCHTSDPHELELLNQHERLDCRTCHARETGGLMVRDWTAEPQFDPITELYSPIDQVAPPNSEHPTYLWHNGERLIPGQGWPGSYGDLDSFIQPFKIFEGIVPVNPDNGKPLPLKLGIFYKTGDLLGAMEAGVEETDMHWDGEWEPTSMKVPLQVSHGIVEAERAVACAECHVPDGRMDFAALGYDEERITLLQSLSSAKTASAQRLQVDFVPNATPAEEKSSEPAQVEEGFSLPVFNTWTIAGALAILLLVIVVVFLILRNERHHKDEGQA